MDTSLCLGLDQTLLALFAGFLATLLSLASAAALFTRFALVLT